MSQVIFFSDLHLDPANEPNHYEIFCELLENFSGKGSISHIVFLGDISIFWPVTSFLGPELARFWNSLEKLKAQNTDLKIVWIAGNHDFAFLKLANRHGIDLRDPDFELVIGEVKYYFAHGDLVNTTDLEYLSWRQQTRSWLFQFVLKLLPDTFARKKILPLAKKVSQKSRLRGPRDDRREMRQLYRKFAEQKWAEGFAGVFLGHNHVQDLYVENNRFYVNLGSWVEGEEALSLPYGVWNLSEKKNPQICAGRIKV